MFKQFTVAAAVASILFVGLAATPASAQSIGDLQAQVQALLQRIAELTSQLNVVQGGQTTVSPPSVTSIMPVPPGRHRICVVLYRNLAQGVSGDDVMSLQEFLQSEGYLSTNPTGYFGPLTRVAVAQWQAKEGIAVAGAFGPLSRDRLKIWCGGGGEWVNKERFTASPTRGNAPLTVLFETWLSGFRPQSMYYTIDFGDGTSERAANCFAPADACQSAGQNRHTYSSNGTYNATLSRVTDPCMGQVACRAAIQSEVVGKVQIVVGPVACTKEYRPVCGSKPIVCITTPCNPIQQTYSNRCMMEADGATFLYEGQCRADVDPSADRRCKSWYDGCNTCSRETPDSPAMCTLRACPVQGSRYCTAYFDSGTNKSPVISEFSGPTTLNVNQVGTWTIKASDPENQQLTYRVTWGDEALAIAPYQSSVARDTFVQTTTFTHAYSAAGTYTVLIVVVDSAGNEAKSSTTVRVGSGAVACTLEYNPVCGQPAWSCPSGLYCATVMPAPQTYSNRCFMNAAGATLLYEGQCQSGGYACTQEAYQCPNGTWVGRTGPNCQFVCQ